MSEHEKESALAWKMHVTRRSEGRCVVSGEAAAHAHHVLPQQLLRRRARELAVDPAWLLWDVRNGIAVSEDTHRRHHNGRAPIPRSVLPQCVFDFAEEFGLSWWLERHAPEEQVAA